MHTRILLGTSLIAVLIAAGSGSAAEVDPELAAAEKTLQEARVATDGPALLAFFRQRTLPPADRKKLAALIRQLGDEELEVRRKAARQLRAAGRAAVSLLRKASMDEDAEIARQARECLQAIEQVSETMLAAAAARVLAARKPKGAALVLLAYLTTVADMGDETVEEAVREALAAVGVQGGKADPALVMALTARQPAQRAAAAFVLGKGAPDQRPAVRRLLADPVPGVRYQAAHSLFLAGDKPAVAALIELLGVKDLDWKAEELLYRLLGNKVPPGELGKDEDSRRKAVRAWKKWWKENEAKVDLARLKDTTPYLGLTLASVYDESGKDRQGRVWLFDKTGKVRWELDNGLGGPIDVRLLRNGRFLLCEHSANRITERDSTGKIFWEYRTGSSPVACQRLRNGNTFIATYSELLEVTPKGVKVFTSSKPANMYYAKKLRNNHIIYAQNSGHVIELDARGKEICNLNLGGMTGWGGVDKLPNGNYLVAKSTAGEVVEVDRTGKVLWKYAIQSPSLATRLPNGNILISSHYGHLLVEVNRKGVEVWKQRVVGRPFRVRRY